jgi:EAL domain-containing protein (putative c-di-GMP-specific phosphodiesterase class I)
MSDDAQDMTIITTIISLAHSLELHVVAEGVETQEQARLLRLMRCNQVQGYYFSKPKPADEVKLLFTDNGSRPPPPSKKAP